MINTDLSIFCTDPVLTSLKDLNIENLWSGIERCVPKGLLDAPISSYRMSNLRYSPREKMVVGLTSNVSRKPISLRIFPLAAMQNRLAKAQQNHPEHTFQLDDLNAIVWVCPGERKLNLDLIADPALLAETLRVHRGYELIDLKLMHFVPEHTYTACVLGRRPGGSIVREYIKIYYNDDGATTARLMDCIAPQLNASLIRIPDDVCYVPEHRLLIQSEVRRMPHRTLSYGAVASALAAFHRLTVACAPVHVDNAQSEHAEVLEIVGKVFPDLASAAYDTSAAVLAAIAETPQSRPVLLHGDAHLGNLFPIADNRIGVIDLDRVMLGRADDDLASFLAFKVWLRLRDKLDPDLVLLELPQFAASYNSCAERFIETRDVYTRLAHKMICERVRRGITRGKVSDSGEILGFLRIARRCLDAARRCHD